MCINNLPDDLDGFTYDAPQTPEMDKFVSDIVKTLNVLSGGEWWSWDYEESVTNYYYIYNTY